jgi:hypothetical protein
MGSIEQDQAGELARRGRRDDLAAESLFRKQRQAAAMIEMRVREQHKINVRRVETEWIGILGRVLVCALMQAAVDIPADGKSR